MTRFPKRVEGVDAYIWFGYGIAEFPFSSRDVNFTKWVDLGLAGLPNRVEGVEAKIWVGYGPAEFPFRGREVNFT